jgi:hypothetical protein
MSTREADMCSNFGLNLHPDRPPCAVQWQWYRLALRVRDALVRRFPSLVRLLGVPPLEPR